MSGPGVFSTALGQVTATLRPRCHSLLDPNHSETLSLSTECLAELNAHIGYLLSRNRDENVLAAAAADGFVVVNGCVELGEEAFAGDSDREASLLRLQHLQRVYDIVQLLLRLRIHATVLSSRSRLSSVVVLTDDAIDAVSTISECSSNNDGRSPNLPEYPHYHNSPPNAPLAINTDVVDLSHLHRLQQLCLEHISADSVRGIHQLRHHLHTLHCCQCDINHLSQLLGDQHLLSSSENGGELLWQQLRELRLLNCSGLSRLDESIGLAGELQLLEVTRCPQLVDIAGVWQLSRLQRLEVSSCRLSDVGIYQPLATAARSLSWMSLRDNQLTNIEGVEHLYNLQHLDVSHNLIMSDSHLWPLYHLNRLRWLNLHGNPVQCARGSRTGIIRRLHRHCLHTDFELDTVRLSVTEITARLDELQHAPPYPLSSTIFPSQRSSSLSALVAVSSVAAAAAEAVVSHRYISRSRPLTSSQFAQPASNSGNSTLNSTPASVRRVKRRPRANIAEIVNVSVDDADVAIDTTDKPVSETGALVGSVASADSAVSSLLVDTDDSALPSHISTRRRIQQLREQLGADHWLHSGGAWMVHQILGLSDQQQQQEQQQEQQQSADSTTAVGGGGGSGETSKPHSPPTQRPTVEDNGSVVVDDVSDIYASRVSASPPEASARDEQRFDLLASPFDVRSDDSLSESDDDVDDILCCVSIDDVIGGDKCAALRLMVTESAVKEKSQLSGRTIQQWDLASVEACHVTKLRPLTVQLNFDTVQKARRERNYIMESAEWRKLNEVLTPILEARLTAELMQSLLQCMKCGAEFPEVMARTAATRTGKRSGGFREIKTCPNCSSDLLISVDCVSHPNQRVANSDPTTPVKSGKTSGVSKRNNKRRSRSKEAPTPPSTSTPIKSATEPADVENTEQWESGKSESSSEKSPDIITSATVNTESSSISVLSCEAAPLPSNIASSTAKPSVYNDCSDQQLEAVTSPTDLAENSLDTPTTHQPPCDWSNSRTDTPTSSQRPCDWSNSRSDTPISSQRPCDWSVSQPVKSSSSLQRCESDVEVISNPSESSIEVLPPQSECLNGSQPDVRCAEGGVVQFDDVILTSDAVDNSLRGHMGESSSSGSLSTSVTTVRQRCVDGTQSPQSVSDPPSSQCHLSPPSVNDLPSSQCHISPQSFSDPPSSQCHISPPSVNDPPSSQCHTSPQSLSDPPSSQCHTSPQSLSDPPSSQCHISPQSVSGPTSSPQLSDRPSVDQWLSAEPASDQLYQLGDSSCRFQFWCMLPRRFDHRIRLHLDLNLVNAQCERLDWYLITSGIVDWNTYAEIPLLLVATTVNLYVLKIVEPISDDISRWLIVLWSAKLTTVTSVECFFGQQAVYVECGSRRRFLAVLRDQRRVQLLLQMLQESCPSVVLQNRWQVETMNRLTSLLIPSDESFDSSLLDDYQIRHMIFAHQYLPISQCIRPVTLCLTSTEMLLLDGCLRWMAPSSVENKNHSFSANSLCDEPVIVYERMPLENLRTVDIVNGDKEGEHGTSSSRGDIASFNASSLPVCHFAYRTHLQFSSSADEINGDFQLFMTSRAAVFQLVSAVRDIQRFTAADSFTNCDRLSSSSAVNKNTSCSSSSSNSATTTVVNVASAPELSPVVFRVI